MPPKSLHKVQKQVTKKKGGVTKTHPESRDSQRLKRGSLRDERVKKLKSLNEKGHLAYLERVAFIQDEVINSSSAESGSTYSPSEILSMITAYIRRNDEDIRSLHQERRIGRPADKREVLLQQRKDSDEKELESGFWAPDVRDAETLRLLRDWNGEWVSLGTMSFVRVVAIENSDPDIKASRFPPRAE